MREERRRESRGLRTHGGLLGCPRHQFVALGLEGCFELLDLLFGLVELRLWYVARGVMG
jgi:hypothetical protein